jgi:PAS domain S-box-containing protein
MNAIGGIAFLAAAAGFLVRYRRSANWHDLLFAVLCALFGTSGLVFDDSVVWTATWWWWHALRVCAYGLALVFSVHVYVSTYRQVRREVVERERAEVALRESQARATAVFDTAVDGIFTLDSEGRIDSVNPSAEAMFGYSAAELIGQHVQTLIPSRYRQHHTRQLFMALRRQGRATMSNARGLRKNGESFPAEISISEIAVGEQHIFACFVRDLSERVALEEQLRHSQKMEAVGTLASGIAHDFNNLLMGISGCADVARSCPDDSEAVRENLAIIKHEAGKGAALSRQLLDFGRKREQAPATLHVDSVVVETESMLRRMLGEDILLDVELAGSDAHVLGDRGQLEQVLLNLGINARDAMPGGGTLSIRVGEVDARGAAANSRSGEREGPYVVLTVRDTGCGMEPEVANRVFEPFFTTKEVGAGTGLGLAMVYGIVQRSGGSVELASEVGKGTTVTIFLPRVDPQIVSEEVFAPSRELRGTETVLLVEDEPAVRRSVRHYLERWGYKVLAARDGREAIDLCRQRLEAVDLVLSDVVLPHMPGPEVAAAIEKLRPGVKVLFMSAYSNEELVGTGRIRIGTRTLHKPFSESELVDSVRRVLGPSVVAPAASTTPAPAPVPPPQSARTASSTILLVEDHAVARQAIGELLGDLGHRVIQAECGEKALELGQAQAGGVDLVVTDIRLPDMSGPDLVRRLRERADTEVIYVSGLAPDDPVVKDALAVPHTAFVQKPADFEEIEQKVNAALVA